MTKQRYPLQEGAAKPMGVAHGVSYGVERSAGRRPGLAGAFRRWRGRRLGRGTSFGVWCGPSWLVEGCYEGIPRARGGERGEPALALGVVVDSRLKLETKLQ